MLGPGGWICESSVLTDYIICAKFIECIIHLFLHIKNVHLFLEVNLNVGYENMSQYEFFFCL